MEIYGKQKKIFANTLYPSSQSVPICVKEIQKYLHLHFILRVVDKSVDTSGLFHQKTVFSMDAISVAHIEEIILQERIKSCTLIKT